MPHAPCFQGSAVCLTSGACLLRGQVCKALCGIAAGSANGAIVEHWARNNNIADVLAKVRPLQC